MGEAKPRIIPSGKVFRVVLKYYLLTGKFVDESVWNTSQDATNEHQVRTRKGVRVLIPGRKPIFQVWAEIEDLIDEGKLPGRRRGERQFLVHAEVYDRKKLMDSALLLHSSLGEVLRTLGELGVGTKAPGKRIWIPRR